MNHSAMLQTSTYYMQYPSEPFQHTFSTSKLCVSDIDNDLEKLASSEQAKRKGIKEYVLLCSYSTSDSRLQT